MTADPTAPAPRGALAREPLAPCPHCGPGQSMCDPVEDILGKRWQVFCGRCGSSSGSYKTEAESIAGWNRREAPALSTAALALDERDPEWPWTPLQAAIEWWQDVADNGVMEPKARAHLQVVLSELRERSGALRVGEAGGWRDISTAPRPTYESKERIDVWMEPIPERQALFANPATEGHRLVDAWWTERTDYTGYRNAYSYNGRVLNYRPTHWMPTSRPAHETQRRESTDGT